MSSKHWCHGHHGPLKASPGAIIVHHATETDCSYAVISNVDGHQFIDPYAVPRHSMNMQGETRIGMLGNF